ncbi:MAG: hypothetical protein HY560_06935 [Gemmatimonadetes bacterium]|nr:hypothetical protein [Gemmatimonadota bacterium]
MASRQPLAVVILTCGSLGFEVAAPLRAVRGVGSVTVISTPYRHPRRTLYRRLRHLYRMEGLPGVVMAVKRKLRGGGRGPNGGPPSPPSDDLALSHHHFEDFHAPECLGALRELHPDLGVVAGTYILREEVFALPRMGCINLHSGKAPEYRGAAPGFWEMYQGETRVGITIHRVTSQLDQGAILMQELFPLDPAPPGDPLAYLERYRETVLRPNGVRLMVEAVAAIAQGTARERPQDPGEARTYRSPDYRAVRELRRRVRERRACAAT